MLDREREREPRGLVDVYRGAPAAGWSRIRWSRTNPGNQAIARERLRTLGGMLRRAGFEPLEGRRILELGCGSGELLASLIQLGASPAMLWGVDMLPDAISAARHAYPALRFQHGNAEQLDFADGAFDLVLVFTLFSSIVDAPMSRAVAREATRVLASSGAVVWYDFRYDSPANPHVRGVGRRGIRALFPGFTLDLRSLTLLPPLARRLGRLTPVGYPLLAAMPPLRTHYLGLLRRAGPQAAYAPARSIRLLEPRPLAAMTLP